MAAGRDRTLTARREIPVRIDRVWGACTHRTSVARWWSPDDLRTTVRQWEPRPGGPIWTHLRYVPALLTPGTADAVRATGVPIALDLRGRFGDVVPDRLLVLDLTIDSGRSAAGISMLPRVELEEAGGATSVRVIASGTDTPHGGNLGQRNLGAQLERLARVCGRSSEPPKLPSR